MFPYTAGEAEWLSTPADFPYWLLGQGDIDAPIPANDDLPPCDREQAR